MSFRSTRGGPAVSFATAVEQGLAPDGGLYLPAAPAARATGEALEALLALPFVDRSVALLGRLVGPEVATGELATGELAAVVRRAFDFPLPLVEVAPGTFVLELFHGPTLAFKDFGARFLAGWLCRRGGGGGERPFTVLTATSGDTGAAVAHAFWQRPEARVVVLYPRGRISAHQERQMATLGGNVLCLEVDGSFDDCQALVKACFAEAGLREAWRLTSANSINVARLLAQVPYYFEAVARLPAAARGRPLLLAVPSGNFGNLAAGLLARQLGLPVAAFGAATNANATVPEHLAGGEYRPRPSVATSSSAMDVGAPSNWERIDALFASDPGLRALVRATSVSEAETLATMAAAARSGYLADPHTAVGLAALGALRREGEVGVVLATAHPAKFPAVVRAATGREVALPEALAATLSRPLSARPVANDFAALVATIGGWLAEQERAAPGPAGAAV